MADKVKQILSILDANYPREECFLTYESPWQLMTATILSAQCTDARVNTVTPVLFAKYPTIQALAKAEFDDVVEIIKSTGFYRNKAANIIASMGKLLTEFGGEMPRDIDILTTFPGVGRKTGNLVLGHVYGIPGIVVDTHVMRVSSRLGLTNAKNPEKIERDLCRVLPEEHWIRYNVQIISHGRAVCTARSPKCARCVLSGFCAYPAHEKT